MVTRRVPRGTPSSLRTSSVTATAAATMCRALWCSAVPACVSAIRRVVRCSRFTPSRSSSRASRLLTVSRGRPSDCAAAVMLPASTIATNSVSPSSASAIEPLAFGHSFWAQSSLKSPSEARPLDSL